MGPNDIRTVQSALNIKGFGPLAEDGIIGPLTRAAIARYKLSNELPDDDVLDFAVHAKLVEEVETVRRRLPLNDDPDWFNELLAMIGKDEHNPEIAAWLRSDGATVGDPAEVPWCSDAVETAFKRAVPGILVPAHPYLAANWATWGRYVTPQRGAVLSFWRGSPGSWKGHVGFYAGESEKHYYVLGGNQGNKVSIAPIEKSRLRENGSRWPVGVARQPSGKKVFMKGGVVTTNEQ